MAGFQVIALDYDGTLTNGERPEPAVLQAVRECRARGRRPVLVTGRILAELREVFPGVDDEFDAIVAENGAVIASREGVFDVAAPVDPALGRALARRDIAFRTGRVILACAGRHAPVVLEEVGRLGLDAQLVRNRGELMVLPAGVTKGTGLLEILGELGVSSHCALAVGDAENDLPLLEVAEVGVAVANAVDSLRVRADLVLEEPDGAGVAALLRGPIVSGERRVAASRRRLEVGTGPEGAPVTIPASQLSLLVTGGSGAGKSYLVGRIVEQLAQLRYAVLVVDREGDHIGLGARRGIVILGGTPTPPSPEDVVALLSHRFGSVVLDLSLLDIAAQDRYLAQLLPLVHDLQASCGSPHWVVFDEAHAVPDAVEADDVEPPPPGGGQLFATYRPQELSAAITDRLDAAVVLGGDGDGAVEAIASVAQRFGQPVQRLIDLLALGVGHAVLLRHDEPFPRAFRVGERLAEHIRHWHKYTDARVSDQHAFRFGPGGRDGIAMNVREFHRGIGRVAEPVLTAHAARGDLSRWVDEVLQADLLAATMRGLESDLAARRRPGHEVRAAMLTSIESHYLERLPRRGAR